MTVSLCFDPALIQMTRQRLLLRTEPVHQTTNAGERQHSYDQQTKNDDRGSMCEGRESELHVNRRSINSKSRTWVQCFGIGKGRVEAESEYFPLERVRS
jgi:hypothetical protein